MPPVVPILKTPPRWPMIARALFSRGDHAGALVAWRKAAIEEPADPTAWSAVALMLTEMGQANAAVPSALAAAALRPDVADVHARLGAIKALAGGAPTALRDFRRALALAPDNAIALVRFGHVALEAGGADLASKLFHRGTALTPGDGVLWAALAKRHLAAFAFDAAERCLMRGIAATPGSASLLASLAELRRDQGEIATALRLYERAIAAGASEQAERALLLALLYLPAASEEMRLGRHLAYARRHAPDHSRPAVRPLDGRRIHVAYLSSGFFNHPTAAVVARLIEAHDRAAFEVSLFAHVRTPDATSGRLAEAADRWVDVHGRTVAEIADAIRAAGVDILVLLAGRYDPVVWPVAALRPAPIQVAFHDTATSGMSALDYLVTDRVLSPRHGQEQAVERLLRLPSFPLHELPAEAPAVSPLPALATGTVTFGSLNNSAKLNDEVLTLWARVLVAVPTARLLMRAPMLASRRLVERVRARFAEAGIAWDRIEPVSGYTQSHAALLRTYERIDIGLDTFPYSGGMTTFESMCQGVPVVTLADRHMVGRWGATLAIHAGHADLVAETEDGFVAIAARLARDLPALAARRARLRQDFLSSPLCDARLKARHLERAYRRMIGAR